MESSEQQAEAAWLGQAELAISGTAQLEDLEQLEKDAGRLAADSAKAMDMAKRVSEKLALARRWETRLNEEAASGSRPGLKEAQSLVHEAEADKVALPMLDQLKATVAQAKGWLDSVRRTQSRSTRGVAVRAGRSVPVRCGSGVQSLVGTCD